MASAFIASWWSWLLGRPAAPPASPTPATPEYAAFLAQQRAVMRGARGPEPIVASPPGTASIVSWPLDPAAVGPQAHLALPPYLPPLPHAKCAAAAAATLPRNSLLYFAVGGAVHATHMRRVHYKSGRILLALGLPTNPVDPGLDDDDRGAECLELSFDASACKIEYVQARATFHEGRLPFDTFLAHCTQPFMEDTAAAAWGRKWIEIARQVAAALGATSLGLEDAAQVRVGKPTGTKGSVFLGRLKLLTDGATWYDRVLGVKPALPTQRVAYAAAQRLVGRARLSDLPPDSRAALADIWRAAGMDLPGGTPMSEVASALLAAVGVIGVARANAILTRHGFTRADDDMDDFQLAAFMWDGLLAPLGVTFDPVHADWSVDLAAAKTVDPSIQLLGWEPMPSAAVLAARMRVGSRGLYGGGRAGGSPRINRRKFKNVKNAGSRALARTRSRAATTQRTARKSPSTRRRSRSRSPRPGSRRRSRLR